MARSRSARVADRPAPPTPIDQEEEEEAQHDCNECHLTCSGAHDQEVSDIGPDSVDNFGADDLDFDPEFVLEEDYDPDGEYDDEIFEALYAEVIDDELELEDAEGEADQFLDDDDNAVHSEDDADSSSDEPIVPKISNKRRKARATAENSSRKRRRIAGPTAAEMIKKINEMHPTDEQDPGVQLFRANFTKLVSRIVSWAKSGTPDEHRDWVYLPPEFREMSSANRFWLMRQDAHELAEAYIAAIPLPAQRILGTPGAKATDLLAMPTGALDCHQWAIYLDVPTRLSPYSIYKVPAVRSKYNRNIKTVISGTNLQYSALEVKAYVGSATSAKGAHTRVNQHLRQANPSTEVERRSNEQTFHYGFTSQPDVVPNFFLGAILEKPDTTDKGDLIKARRLVVMLEALFITYLGLCPQGINTQYCPLAVSDFNTLLRKSLDLPDLSGITLNRSWPLWNQSGGRKKCGNCHGKPNDKDRCKACKHFLVAQGSERPIVPPEDRVCSVEDCTGTKYEHWYYIDLSLMDQTKMRCHRCYIWWRKHGCDRTRFNPGEESDETFVCSMCEETIKDGFMKRCKVDVLGPWSDQNSRCMPCQLKLRPIKVSPMRKDENGDVLPAKCAKCDRKWAADSRNFRRIDSSQPYSASNLQCRTCYARSTVKKKYGEKPGDVNAPIKKDKDGNDLPCTCTRCNKTYPHARRFIRIDRRLPWSAENMICPSCQEKEKKEAGTSFHTRRDENGHELAPICSKCKKTYKHGRQFRRIDPDQPWSATNMLCENCKRKERDWKKDEDGNELQPVCVQCSRTYPHLEGFTKVDGTLPWAATNLLCRNCTRNRQAARKAAKIADGSLAKPAEKPPQNWTKKDEDGNVIQPICFNCKHTFKDTKNMRRIDKTKPFSVTNIACSSCLKKSRSTAAIADGSPPTS